MINECLLLFVFDGTALKAMIFCVRELKLTTFCFLKLNMQILIEETSNCVCKIKKSCYKVMNSALQWVKDSDKILCTYLRNITVQRSTTHWLWYGSSDVVAYQFIKSYPVLLTYFSSAIDHHQVRNKSKFLRAKC
jgi:hypothetical protein